jgi:hypothetical protein
VGDLAMPLLEPPVLTPPVPGYPPLHQHSMATAVPRCAAVCIRKGLLVEGGSGASGISLGSGEEEECEPCVWSI